MRKWFSRLAALAGRKRIDEDLLEELSAHLQMEVDANIERGMSPNEAIRLAHRTTGNLTLLRESSREAWGFPILESVFQDFRFGARLLRRNPGFTAAAVLTLALGIGANTAIFTVIKTVLLAPLPYPQADRIVQLESKWDDLQPHPNVSILKFVTFSNHYQIFEDATLYWAYGARVNLTSGDRPEQVGSLHVSANYFKLFGAAFGRGGGFTASEDRPGGPNVAVISDGLWRRRFAEDPQLVGKTIGIGGAPYQVAGILKPRFYWEYDVDVWLPLQADLGSMSPSHEYYAAARLRPGVSLAQANAVMAVAFEQYRQRFPALAFAGHGLAAESVQTVVTKDIRPTLSLLFGAGLLVLLIACANLANLLLARGSARDHEIAIRAALTASRARIIRQLFTESVLLSAGGSLIGLVLGWTGVRILLWVSLASFPRLGARGSGLVLDWEVMAFAAGLGLLTTVFYGLMPAVQAVRTEIGSSLQSSGTRTATGGRQPKMRSLLVIAEISVAVVLLVGAALLMRTYAALRSVHPGFDGTNVIALDMSVYGPRYQKAAEVARLAHEGAQRVEALAGVKAAATTWSLPLEPPSDPQFFTIEGRPLEANKPYHGIGDWRIVTPHYFDVFRIPILRGRFFTDHDGSSEVPVVIINNQMAKALWPNDNPLGRQIWLNKGLGPGFEEPAPRRIIGIAGDVKDSGLSTATGMLIYVPVAQVQDSIMPFYSGAFRLMWVVRTATEPFALSESIKRSLAEASGGLPVGHVRSMDQVRAESTARIDFTTSLFTILAALALLMAAIGVYGVMAYTVERRRGEIAIRVAVGASPRNVIEMILRESARLTLTGIAIGLTCGLALSKLLASLLYGVTPYDPVAFVAVGILLGVVALFSASIPARKATRVDPVVALRRG